MGTTLALAREWIERADEAELMEHKAHLNEQIKELGRQMALSLFVTPCQRAAMDNLRAEWRAVCLGILRKRSMGKAA